MEIMANITNQALYPREKKPRIHCTGSVGPTASLDILEMRIIPSPWYPLDRRLDGPTAGANT